MREGEGVWFPFFKMRMVMVVVGFIVCLFSFSILSPFPSKSL